MDRIDRKILSILQEDGRIANLKLAEAVALSPTAVLARVQRLTREGYILGYEARLNPEKLGAAMLVFIEILLDRTVQDVMDNFKAAVQARPEILECHLLSGASDYRLRVAARNVADFDRLHRHCLSRLPGVAAMHSAFALRTIKAFEGYPIPPRADVDRQRSD